MDRNAVLARIRLFGISFVSLFLELALIRFINSTVQVVSYFNNFLLLSAFLGLGLGSLLVRRRTDWFARFPWVFFVVVGVMVFLDRYGFQADTSDQVFWAVAHASDERNLPAPLVVLVVFCLNLLFFVPLGYKLGRCLQEFEDKLVAYAYDLAGSLLGVIGFGIVSWMGTSPVLWFSLAGGVILLLRGDLSSKQTVSRKALGAGLLLALGTFLATLPGKGFWSPYYKVTIQPYFLSPSTRSGFLGFSVMVDKLRIQDALLFSPDLRKSPLADWIDYYRLPYLFRSPKRVLILGGGSGNDATVALAQGAEHVDVVEIDPLIVAMGYALHPHKPYRDPRVTVITDDARAFLRRNRDVYDLVVMNALDSHHQIPGLSTLRLESFVYTVEAFRDVRRHMTPQSLFVVHLGSTRPWMGERLFATLTEAFGAEPRLFRTAGSPFGSVAFAFGPEEVFARMSDASQPRVLAIDPGEMRRAQHRTLLSTDDWPHLYLRTNRIPSLYLIVLAAILAVTLLAFRGLGSVRTPEHFHFFLLGAGFMLLETRSITKSALLFGSTWIVNAIVVSAVLAVILVGNQIVRRGPRLSRSACYLGLFGMLLAGYFLPLDRFLDYPIGLRIPLAGLWLGAPIFFASLVFSQAFERASETATAFGSNLLGVVVGGLLEYSSMIAGLNALYLIAFATYLLAATVDMLFVGPRTDKVPGASSPPVGTG